MLVAIDRVLLKHMTGDFAAVGIYTIGYSLAMQINVFMNATLSEAFVPGGQPGLRQPTATPRCARSRTGCCCR